ncbi:MAG: radical SAM family heme chaperone HemW [Pseudomonadota bacterium]
MEPELVPLSLYVHLPWCVKKCPYCDFNSHTSRQELPKSQYIEQVLGDLNYEVSRLDNPRPLVSIFFGGGTPSLFSAKEIGRIIQGAKSLLPVNDTLEVTLEANPGTVEHDSFQAYREVGVTRVSLGIQSLNDHSLNTLGRIHNSQAAEQAIQQVRNEFDNFNLDLMFALPGQKAHMATADIQQLLNHQPPHVSYYQLTLEPGTAFYARPPQLPEDEQAWEMQTTGRTTMQNGGLEQYEVSAFAQPGKRCEHNVNYWQYGDYIGVGAGAHGKLTQADGLLRRTQKQRLPNNYMNSKGDTVTVGRQTVSCEEQLFEFMLNELRQIEGASRKRFETRTYASLAQLDERLAAPIEKGLLRETPDGWAATDLGWRFLNDLQACFLPNK